MRVATRPASEPWKHGKPSFLSMLPLAILLASCGGNPQESTQDASDPELNAAAVTTDTITSAPACFYRHINYQGETSCTNANVANLISSGWNDRISSIKVASGYTVELFEHVNYLGRSLKLSADTSDLMAEGFNDIASSMKITAPATSTPPINPVATPSPPVSSIQVAQSLLFNSDDSALVLVSGKAALVKVNVTSIGKTTSTKPSGTLRVTSADGAMRDLLLTAPTGALPAAVSAVPSFTDSYTATVPADLVKTGVKFTALIGNAAGKTIAPRVGGGVPMKFVPISVQIAGTAGKLPVSQAAHLQALFPVSSVSVQSHPAYVSSRVTTLPTTETDWRTAYSKILGELADLHMLEGAATHDHYYGFIPKRTWGLVGLAYPSGNVGVGTDMPEQPTAVRDIVAHEMGHNFSLQHAACGDVAVPDLDYPYPNATLGEAGRYIWPYLADSNTFYDPRPTDRHDIMSYCGGQVFSDYNYRKMQTYLTPSDKSMVNVSAAAVTSATQDLLLISGEIGASGTAELNPVKSLVGRPQAPEAGAYTLRIVSASGTVDIPFAPRTLDHDSTLQHFGFTIPNPGAIQGITVLQGGKTLLNSQARAAGTAVRAQAVSAPRVQVQESGGAQTLTWDAARHPYLTVTWVGTEQRRTLAQDLRGGSATLSSADLPTGGSFELGLSDGLNAVRVSHTR
jgi:hypothetical protein